MFVSKEWLNELVDIQEITAQELSDKMSTTGIEVEGVVVPKEGLKNIVVGFVKECLPHPESDHLHICQVDVGDTEAIQVVCGAPNIQAGVKVIVALPAARIAGNHKIKKGKIRGQVSHGMICSLQELGINESVVPKEFADGIYYLPEEAIVGEEVFSYLGMNDAILELSITPNRADALSMRGVAHEVAAIYHKKVKFQPLVLKEDEEEKIEDYIRITVEDTDDVPTYNMRVIKNVTIAPSPLWLQQRLMNEGIRPINNVVDVTNYILLYYGQPLHAFDYKKLKSTEILTRRARNGEILTTLDGEERKLSQENIVITNGQEAVALAGVMGGLDTEIDHQTTTVALEAALFNGSSIRLTSKEFNLRSESSARFEKGVNQATVVEAMNEAAAMIADLGKGNVVKGFATSGVCTLETVHVVISLAEINHYLGTKLSMDEVKAVFEALAFHFEEKDGTYDVSIPPRRWDIKIKQDIIEEVARIYGYENLPSTLPQAGSAVQGLSKEQQTIRQIQTNLEASGLSEIISYALTTEKKSKEFALEKESKHTKLDWPMSEERSSLRMNLVSGMLDNVAYNVARKKNDVAFYEMGRVFTQTGNPQTDLPKESTHLAFVMSGNRRQKDWQTEGDSIDFFVIKGVFEHLCERLGLTEEITYEQTSDPEQMHPGRCADVLFKGEKIGYLGQVHPLVAKEYEIEETYVAEISLEKILAREEGNIIFEPITKFPEITRDIALLVDEKVTNHDVLQQMKRAAGKLLKEVHLFDLFVGEKLGENKKSLAYTLTFSNGETMRTEEEIQLAMQKIEKKLEEMGAKIR